MGQTAAMEAPTTSTPVDLAQTRPVWFTMLYNAPRKGDDMISPDYKLYVEMLAKLVSAGFINFAHNYLNIPAMVDYKFDKDLFFVSSYQEFYDTFNPSDDDRHRSLHLGQLASISRFVVVTKQDQLPIALQAIPVIPKSYLSNSPYVDGDNCLSYLDGDGTDLAKVLKDSRTLLPTDVVKLRRNVVETLLVEQEMQKRSDAVALDIADVRAERAKDMQTPVLVGADGKPLK